MQIRVFFAHPATMVTGEIEEFSQMVRDDMLTVIGGKTINSEEIKVAVIPGRKDHQHFFPQAGSWGKWAADVVSRKNSTTKRRMYDMFVVPGESCGRATKSIIQNALKAKRAVFSWNSYDREFFPVVGVRDHDALDWSNGTQLILAKQVQPEPEQLEAEPEQLPLFPENS